MGFCAGSNQVTRELYLKKKEIPNYFIEFFDLRKEFSKVFNLNLNLFKMIDFLEIKNGLLLSGAEYCDSISKVIEKLLEKGKKDSNSSS